MYQTRVLRDSSAGLSEFIESLDPVADVDVLAPIIAGVRARAIADTFETAKVAAVLLDKAGMVLHVGGCAERFLGGVLTITCRHLLANAPRINRALERLIASAIAGKSDAAAVEIDRIGCSSLQIRAVPLADVAEDPMQLLKAVLIIVEI